MSTHSAIMFLIDLARRKWQFELIHHGEKWTLRVWPPGASHPHEVETDSSETGMSFCALVLRMSKLLSHNNAL